MAVEEAIRLFVYSFRLPESFVQSAKIDLRFCNIFFFDW